MHPKCSTLFNDEVGSLLWLAKSGGDGVQKALWCCEFTSQEGPRGFCRMLTAPESLIAVAF